MKKLRRQFLWFGLILIIALAGFSVYGAFLGAQRAQQFFNSVPLSVYWTVFGLTLAASIFVFPRLLKFPGLLAMHVGCVLIIAGSMWGSAAGHHMQRKYLNSDRIPSGRMSIVEGFVQDKVYMENSAPVNQSLSSIKADSHSIKYRYDKKTIEVTKGDEVINIEPIVIDSEIDLGEDMPKITPLRLFENLRFKTEGGERKAVDQPGGGSTPAVEVMYSKDGKETKKILADVNFYNLPFLIKVNDFRIEYYDPGKITVLDEEGIIWSGKPEMGEPIELGGDFGTITPTKSFKNFIIGENGSATDRPGDTVNPAIEILVDLPGKPQQKKYAFEKFPDFCVIDNRYVIRYRKTISDYISELEVVTEDGKMLASKDIEVNKPLHYGGYHFYQSSYQDVGGGKYATILSLTSDSGLYIVYAGFIAMCGGIVYHQWLRPITNKYRRKRKESKTESQPQEHDQE